MTLRLCTGPCQPDGLSLTYHCTNRSALLSWTPRPTAVHYYGCAEADGGDVTYCHSAGPSCTILGLDCGRAYNFSVKASDGTCNSSTSDPVLAQAGTNLGKPSNCNFISEKQITQHTDAVSPSAPCPPDAVEVQLLPVQMDVQGMRFHWNQSDCDNTTYLLRLTGNLLGDIEAQFDLSSYWTGRTSFEMPLPCGSSYQATVESRNPAGGSAPSTPLVGTTGERNLRLLHPALMVC